MSQHPRMSRVGYLLAVAAIGSAGLAVPQAAMARTSTVKDCDERKAAAPATDFRGSKPVKVETKKKRRYILM